MYFSNNFQELKVTFLIYNKFYLCRILLSVMSILITILILIFCFQKHQTPTANWTKKFHYFQKTMALICQKKQKPQKYIFIKNKKKMIKNFKKVLLLIVLNLQKYVNGKI